MSYLKALPNLTLSPSVRASLVTAAVFAGLTGAVSPAQSATCVGNCGVLGPDGVVTAPPGGGTYGYVSTDGGVSGAGQIATVGGTNGSLYTSDTFVATAGQMLSFNFNYVTSDGTGSFVDYGWAALVDSSNAVVAYLFTGRTTPTGNTSPGFGLPANAATLTPAATPIIAGGPEWSPLGGSSGACYSSISSGCGYTGWIGSTYSIASAGTYAIQFGVTNYGDTDFDSGLAYSGLALDGAPIDTGSGNSGAVPEPATWAMMIVGFALVGASMRRRTDLRVRFS